MKTTPQQLASIPWKKLNVEGEKYYFKLHTTKESYTIVITNLVRVWLCECDKNDIERTVEEYCPQLSMNTSDLIDTIKEQLLSTDNNSNTKLVLQIQDKTNILKLTIHATLNLAAKVKLPFKWRIKCFPSDKHGSTFIKEQIIEPCLGMLNYLASQVKNIGNSYLYLDLISN